MNNVFKLSGALQIGKLTAAPANPQEGYIYYNTTVKKYYMYNSVFGFQEVALDILVNTLTGGETTKAPTVAAVSSAISAEASARISGDNSLASQISTSSSSLAAETSARASADASLAARILAEESTRAYVDDLLEGMISTEASNRAAGDAYTEELISSEASQRTSADSSLDSKISAEASARTSGDSSLASQISSTNSSLTAETSARTSADSSLDSKISAETSNRLAADLSLTTKIDGEESRAQAAELSLNNEINSETSRAESAEAMLQGDINSEISRAESAEASLASQISAETSARTSADASLEAYISTSVGGGVSAEESARISADASLASQISAEASARAAADSSLSSQISDEASARASADSSLDSKISAEESARISADSSLNSEISLVSSDLSDLDAYAQDIRSDLDAEISARASSELSLYGNILSENSRAQSAEASLDSKISTETSARTAADTSLAGSINNVAANLSTETSSRVAADSSLSSQISVLNGELNSEASRALAAETSLNSKISTETSARTAADNSLDSKISAEESTRAAADTSLETLANSKVSKAGDTMSGNLNMDGNSILGLAAPTNANDAVRKSYVDGLISGATWLNPIQDPDLIHDSLSTPPGSPEVNAVYIVGSSATGAWTGLEGHAVFYTGTAWTDLLGRAVQVGDRFGVGFYTITAAAGGLTGKDNQIAEITTATPGSIAYTFTAPLNNQAVYVSQENSTHFGHSYNYNGTSWVEFGGPGATNAGIGLVWDGNTLNVKLGAGIAELPSDEIGIDLYSAAGLHLTEDGTTDSTAADAKLSIKIDGATLSKTSSGVKVATGGITDTQINGLAGIAFSKMAALTANKALVSDISGVVIASSVTATELGHLAGVTSNIQTQLDTKLENVGDDGTPELGGDLDVNGKAIEGASSDIVLAGQNSVKRAKQASKSSFVEEEYIHSISLSASQTNTVISSLNFAHATVEGIEMTYKMKDSAGAVRIGTLRVVTNGTDVAFVDTFGDSADLGISFSASINGSNVEIKYSSGATTATLRADVKKFLA